MRADIGGDGERHAQPGGGGTKKVPPLEEPLSKRGAACRHHCCGRGVSLVIAVGRIPFGPLVKSSTLPSARRCRRPHTSSALSRGLRATNENSANSPGGMFIVQT